VILQMLFQVPASRTSARHTFAIDAGPAAGGRGVGGSFDLVRISGLPIFGKLQKTPNSVFVICNTQWELLAAIAHQRSSVLIVAMNPIVLFLLLQYFR